MAAEPENGRNKVDKFWDYIYNNVDYESFEDMEIIEESGGKHHEGIWCK
ncbi:hypothetical protein IMSAGC003_00417 [Lachnospiraceae bacterium]|nr:hypothetical protein IMSAGC003_00417 [Lachnospiraceae bacterium]